MHTIMLSVDRIGCLLIKAGCFRLLFRAFYPLEWKHHHRWKNVERLNWKAVFGPITYVILYQYYMLQHEAVQRVLQCVATALISIDWIRYNSNAVLYREHSRGFRRVVL